MGVDMGGVIAAFGQDVDPEVFEHKLAVAQIELQILGEFCDVLVEAFNDVLKDRKAPRQVGERGVGGVTGIAFVLAPFLAGLVIFGNGIAAVEQLVLIDLGGEFTEFGFVKTGDEKGFDIGHVALR